VTHRAGSRATPSPLRFAHRVAERFSTTSARVYGTQAFYPRRALTGGRRAAAPLRPLVRLAGAGVAIMQHLLNNSGFRLKQLPI